ncbi:MAG: glycosyltransferase family 39 protein [Planctomycetes bacterium]|nr:glycosyltransferase family 39 protein [Planctomycetota bacterium]
MARKKRRPTQQDKSKPAKARSAPKTQTDLTKVKTIAIAVIVIAIAAIPFAMGKYLEFNTPGPYDSGAYVYSARHIFEGVKLGTGERISAQPGTLLVNFIGVALFGYGETGPILIQMVLQITALLLMFFAMRKLFGMIGASVGVIMASLFLSAPVIAKFGNVKEQYMIAFMVITASCFVMRMVGGRAFWAVLTGAAAINIYYFKQTGASVIVAMAVCLLAGGIFRTRTWRTIRNDILFIIAGAAIGITPLVSLYTWQNRFAILRKTLPCTLLFLAIKLVVFFFVIYLVVRLCKLIDLRSLCSKHFRVRRCVWVPGLCLVAVVFIPCMVYFNSFVVNDIQLDSQEEIKAQQQAIEEQGYMDWYKGLDKDEVRVKKGGELGSYLNSVPFIKYPLKIVRYPLYIIERAYDTVSNVVGGALGTSGYAGASRKLRSFKELSAKVFRFYLVLILPVSIAIISLFTAAARGVLRLTGKLKKTTAPDQIVILFIVWWILDMAFIWISPRSYEQYYLPITASAAMLGGYICFLYASTLAASANKIPWRIAGIVAAVCMTFMTIHIFRGWHISQHTGTRYDNKRYGFKQSLDRVANRKKGAIGSWEKVAAYIKNRTAKDDPIYVWGWYPGIYVQAQRFSSAKKPFESEMNVMEPSDLGRQVSWLLRLFKKNPPKFIVDTRKPHYPWTYPPLELWPSHNPWGSRKLELLLKEGFLPNQKIIIEGYDKQYSQFLAKQISPDQAERYKAMAPLRKFVMDNYTIAEPKQYVKTSNGSYIHRVFYKQRVFRLKTNPPHQELK